jgi:hypothetical protein
LLTSQNSELKNGTTGIKPDRSAGTIIWEAYSFAYRKRYGVEPVSNEKVRSQIKQLCKRLPVTDAPLVAEFFVTHNDAFYVKTMHPVGMLLKDAEKLHTEWSTGKRMLGSQAREVERMQHNSNSWDEAARLLNQRRQDHEAV